MSQSMEDILDSEALPTLPEVALQVLEITQKAEPDIEELVSAVRSDPAIAARILKTANSAMFGLRYRAASIEAAVPLLGLNMVRMLVMGFSLAALRTSRSVTTKPWYQLLWKQSLIQASAAETIAHHVSGADSANWFLAGLLQDVGRLAMLSAREETYIMEVLSSLDETPIEDRERRAFGFSHTDISMALCRRWQLGDEFVDAIATHHDSSEFVIAGDYGVASLATALKTSAMVVDYFEQVVSNRSCNRDVIDRLLMLVFGLAPDEVTETLADIDARAAQIAAAFSVDVGQNRSLERILEDAQELLFEIATRSQLQSIQPSDRAALPANKRVSEPVASDANSLGWLDPLTHVFSRELLKAASLEFEKTQKRRLCSGVLFIDIDNFATLNAHHSSSLGDEVLRRIASVIKMGVRPRDFTIRFGGDEFLVFLPEMTPDLLARIANRLNERIAEIRLSCTEDIVVSVSIGAIACQADKKILSLDTIIQDAQRATQKARTVGGNQTAVFIRESGKLFPHRAMELCVVSR